MTELARRGLAGALAWMLLASVANAEPSPVERCRAAPTDAERIACLEAALGAPPGAGEASGEEPDDAAVPGNRRTVEDIGAEQVRARQRGQDELESARGLTVERYTTVPYRRLQVELANGQVWRQIEGDTQRIRVDLERNRTVDIEESALGGYKLRLNEIGRTIRVERIR